MKKKKIDIINWYYFKIIFSVASYIYIYTYTHVAICYVYIEIGIIICINDF